MAQSETIVIARTEKVPAFKDHKVSLEILQVLKGKLEPGKHEVKFTNVPHGGPGEFVAFLDKERVWCFSAIPLTKNKVDQDVLAVSGFYDSNAHWVTPGLVTVEQLKRYIKDGTLVYKFRGDVFFPQPGKKEWKAGTINITGTYDAVKGSADVKGLPPMRGFPAQPAVFVQSWDGSNIDLEYSPHNNRPLKFMGKVDELDLKTGEMVVRYAVTAPEILTQKTLEEYLADDSKGPCFYTFQLACEPTREHPNLVLKLAQGKESADQIEGWGKKTLKIISTSYSGPTLRSGSALGELPKNVARDLSADDWVLRLVAPTETGDYLVLAIDLGEPKEDPNVFRWSFRNEILYALYSHPLRGRLQLHNGKELRTITTFATSLDSAGFVPNESSPKKNKGE